MARQVLPIVGAAIDIYFGGRLLVAKLSRREIIVRDEGAL